MEKVPAYRTVITVIILGAFMVTGAFLLKSSEAGGKMFSDLVLGLGLLGGVQGMKSGLQSLAQGTGVKGAVAALMTDAKPGEPAPPSVTVTETAVKAP